MQAGDHYVVNSANTLYYLPNSSCSEGASVTLSNTQVIRVYNVNGIWTKGDLYTTGNYSTTSYICHIWSETSPRLDPNFLVLPAVIIVLCFLSVVFNWFSRYRG